jgi:hypothetical protein
MGKRGFEPPAFWQGGWLSAMPVQLARSRYVPDCGMATMGPMSWKACVYLESTVLTPSWMM